jgi:hypothetical protein
MKVQIGKNTLGSGGKMSVDLKTYERSTHDLSYIWRSSMSSGTLVPFMNEVALPGDTHDITLDCNVLTHPTEGPLFGSYKVQLDVFTIPIRLYNAQLMLNKLNIGMDMQSVKLPQLFLNAPPIDPTATANVDPNQQVNPSSILSYLGIRGVGVGAYTDTPYVNRNFNAIPYLNYFEIFKNYYANKQEKFAYIIHTDPQVVPRKMVGMDVDVDPTTWDSLKGLQGPGITGGSSWALEPGQLCMVQMDTSLPSDWPTPDQIIVVVNGLDVRLTDLFSNISAPVTSPIRGYQCSNPTITQTVILDWWDYAAPGQFQPMPPKLVAFDLTEIDDMRNIIMSQTATGVDVIIDQFANGPYKLPLMYDGINAIGSATNTQEGLLVKTYQSDQFNNWIKSDWIEGPNSISAITAINTSSGEFTIDTFNLAEKVYYMLNRIAISGGSYNDWIETVWTNDTFRQVQTPVYVGGLSKELVFQEVVSNSTTLNAQGGVVTPLGQLAGRGTMSQKHKGGQIIVKTSEPSYIMGIVSLTPRIDYSEGNKWDVNLKTMDDFHKPQLDEIGYQDLITDQMAWFDTTMVWNTTTNEFDANFNSAGKQPAWINYMTNVNQTRGNFAIENNEMFMTLNRRYEWTNTILRPGIKDLTTYIDPQKYNFIFAETSLDAQNFWTQISVNIEARRKMSAKQIPNL